jgi:hypothetical protein
MNNTIEINANGVLLSIINQRLYLVYHLDSSCLTEAYFSSVDEALTAYNIASLDEVSLNHLLIDDAVR